MRLTSNFCSLENLLEYECLLALKVFQRKYTVTDQQAKDLWKDMLRWLWLGRFYQADKDINKPDHFVVFPQIILIDEMWHCFILCTKEYTMFCNHYFSSYIHHEPNSDSENILPESEYLKNIQYVQKHLGKIVSLRWYVMLPIICETIQEKSSIKSN